MGSRYQNIIFDLDGTLIKSEEGLFDAITYACMQSGVDPGERKNMNRMIGPVLWESFQNFYHMSPEEADRAYADFTDFYEREGVYNVSVYDGVREMLQTLQDEGKTLLVVTAKPINQAETVLDHIGLARYFKAVAGPSREDKKTDKVFLLNKAFAFLDQSGEEWDKEGTVMVGDRMFDMEGAAEVGIGSIGVLYGYGDREELSRAGATWFADSPAEVVKLVCGDPL